MPPTFAVTASVPATFAVTAAVTTTLNSDPARSQIKMLRNSQARCRLRGPAGFRGLCRLAVCALRDFKVQSPAGIGAGPERQCHGRCRRHRHEEKSVQRMQKSRPTSGVQLNRRFRRLGEGLALPRTIWPSTAHDLAEPLVSR